MAVALLVSKLWIRSWTPAARPTCPTWFRPLRRQHADRQQPGRAGRGREGDVDERPQSLHGRRGISARVGREAGLAPDFTATLEVTVERFNGFAAEEVDADFGRVRAPGAGGPGVGRANPPGGQPDHAPPVAHRSLLRRAPRCGHARQQRRPRDRRRRRRPAAGRVDHPGFVRRRELHVGEPSGRPWSSAGSPGRARPTVRGWSGSERPLDQQGGGVEQRIRHEHRTGGQALFDGSRPLAAATLPIAGISVDWTNCSYAATESHTSTP